MTDQLAQLCLTSEAATSDVYDDVVRSFGQLPDGFVMRVVPQTYTDADGVEQDHAGGVIVETNDADLAARIIAAAEDAARG